MWTLNTVIYPDAGRPGGGFRREGCVTVKSIATSKEMLAASHQELDEARSSSLSLPPPSSGAVRPCQHFDFGLLILILDFWPSELEELGLSINGGEKNNHLSPFPWDESSSDAGMDIYESKMRKEMKEVLNWFYMKGDFSLGVGILQLSNKKGRFCFFKMFCSGGRAWLE